MVSIRILDDIGIDYAVDFVSHFGFQKNNLPKALSLALGSLSISPMDLTTAYAVFANGGYKIEPYLIDRITDANGKVLLQAKPAYVPHPGMTEHNDRETAPRVIPEDVAFLMHTALLDVVQHGTAHEATVLNRNDIAGKTGTTNEQVDAWFAGYNPSLVVTTWVGFDTPHPLYEYAARLALPLWIDFMKIALHGQPEKYLTQPENVVTARIDPNSGLLANPDTPNAITEYFRKEEVPAQEERQPNDESHSPMEYQENLF